MQRFCETISGFVWGVMGSMPALEGVGATSQVLTLTDVYMPDDGFLL